MVRRLKELFLICVTPDDFGTLAVDLSLPLESE
jgi:hypothetical protein